MISRHCILVMEMWYNAIMLCYNQFTCTITCNQNVSSPLTRKDSILLGVYVTDSSSHSRVLGLRPPGLSSHDLQEVVLAQFSLYVHTEAPHNIESLRVRGKETFCFLEGQSGVRTRDHRLSKQAALTTVPGSPLSVASNHKYIIQLCISAQTHITAYISERLSW